MSYVAYYRVSGARQGETGIGLEYQQIGVERFMNGKPIAEFTDVISGSRSKLSKRHNIFRAIDYSNKHNIPLVLFRLDRLGRDNEFLSKCLNDDINFIALDFPMSHTMDKAAKRMMLTVAMAFAEYESDKGSDRSKRAHEILRQRGVKVGRNQNFTDEDRKKAAMTVSMNNWTPDKSIALSLYKEFTSQGLDKTRICEKISSITSVKYDLNKLSRLLKSAKILGKHE